MDYYYYYYWKLKSLMVKIGIEKVSLKEEFYVKQRKSVRKPRKRKRVREVKEEREDEGNQEPSGNGGSLSLNWDY